MWLIGWSGWHWVADVNFAILTGFFLGNGLDQRSTVRGVSTG